MLSAHQFLVLYLSLLATMLVCRCVPMFALKGRDLSPAVRDALGLIPAAAFAALVANDLLKPDLFAGGMTEGLLPILAAVPVVVVARRTGSLIACAVVGVVAYALLGMVV